MSRRENGVFYQFELRFRFCWLSNQNSFSVFYICSVKFHHVKETHDINSFLTLVKIVVASQHKRQPNKSLLRFAGD